MKKISFRVRNFDKEQFLTFNIDNNAELDEEVLDFLEDEEPEGVVPVIFEEGEEYDTFSYDITGRIQLKQLSEQEINAEMVLKVIRGLVLSMMDMSEYRIPLSYLVLNRQYIYIDSDYKVEFVCIPLDDMKDETDLACFLRNFIASLRFDSSENGDYVAKILTYINDEEMFNLHNLLDLVEEWMDLLGIEIPEGESNEIYGEYMEIDEEPEEGSVAAFFENQDEQVDEESDEIEKDVDVESPEEGLEEQQSEEAADDENNVDEAIEEGVEYTEADDSVVEKPEDTIESDDAVEKEAEATEETIGDEKSYENEEAEEIIDNAEAYVNEVEEAVKEPEDIVDEAEAYEVDKPIESEAVETEPDKDEVKEPEVVDTEEKVSSQADSKEDSDDGEDTKQDEDSENNKESSGGKKKKLFGSKSGNEKTEDSEDKKEKKQYFKTKEIDYSGVVLEDELDALLAEEEKKERFGRNFRRNNRIKINRASILQTTKEELEIAEAEEKAYIAKVRQEEEEAFLAKQKAEEEARQAEEDAKKAAEEARKAEEEAKKEEEDAKKAAKKAAAHEAKKESGVTAQFKKLGGLFSMNKDDTSKDDTSKDERKDDNKEDEPDNKSENDTTDNADVEAKTDTEDNKEDAAEDTSEKEDTMIDNAKEKDTAATLPKVNPYLIRVNTDERIMINKQVFKIGKSGMSADYTITGNGAISRIHAIITCKDGNYFIKDNKSTNHTFVNGESVEDGETKQLTNDCKIVLGDEEFIFKI